MRLSNILVSTLAATAYAAPSGPRLNLKDMLNPASALDELSEYFNLIASKVQASRFLNIPPTCDVSKAQMPTLPAGIGSPAPGLTVRHVAVGRGTQNYTCDTTKPDSAPVAAGAVATLFNATCVASMYPDVLERLPGMAVHFNLDVAQHLGPAVMEVSGKHFFRDAKTPFFTLNTPTLDIGEAPCSANSSAAAPSTASVGQKGEPAVKWLRLTTKDGATGDMKEVWRVNTAGGSPPASCKAMPATFEVQYAAVYWFWEGPEATVATRP